jgi:hypothetical protein
MRRSYGSRCWTPHAFAFYRAARDGLRTPKPPDGQIGSCLTELRLQLSELLPRLERALELQLLAPRPHSPVAHPASGRPTLNSPLT